MHYFVVLERECKSCPERENCGHLFWARPGRIVEGSVKAIVKGIPANILRYLIERINSGKATIKILDPFTVPHFLVVETGIKGHKALLPGKVRASRVAYAFPFPEGVDHADHLAAVRLYLDKCELPDALLFCKQF